MGDKLLSLSFKRRYQLLSCAVTSEMGFRFKVGKDGVRTWTVSAFCLLGIVDCLRFMPFTDNMLEGIGFRERAAFFISFLRLRINAVGKQLFASFRFVRASFRGDNRIFPETEQLFLVVEAVCHAPEF